MESIPGLSYINSLTEMEPGRPFILISNTHTEPQELPQRMLDDTALMVHPNSGYDNFPRSFVQKAAFPIVVGNPIRANAVSEYILSAIFHHFTPMTNHPYWSADRKWDRKLLRDQKVLIIGMGKVGKLVFQSLSPICAAVDVFDPYVGDAFNHASMRKELNDEVLKGKSIVVVAASLTSTSKGLIDLNFLKKLPPEVLLVNAARGEIINEEDLVSWLRKDEKSRAYLDVFAEEPFRPGFLSDVRNANKTSHIAGVHGSLNDDIIEFEKLVIKDFCEFFDRSDVEGFKKKYKELILTENSINYQ